MKTGFEFYSTENFLFLQSFFSISLALSCTIFFALFYAFCGFCPFLSRRQPGNFQKFLQNPALKDFLLRTGDKILVEASPRDRIWGIGMGASNENAENPAAWRGRNLLGFALMEVRDELRRVCANEDKIDWKLGKA